MDKHSVHNNQEAELQSGDLDPFLQRVFFSVFSSHLYFHARVHSLPINTNAKHCAIHSIVGMKLEIVLCF